MTSIGDYAFYRCSGLTSVTIGGGVVNIGNDAFLECERLKDVYCMSKKIPEVGACAFDHTSISSVTLHVPTASLEQYKKTEPWSEFGKIVALTEEELKQK